MLWPLSEKPLFASKVKLRMPNGVVYVSTTEPLTETVVTTEYIVGEVSDQIFGFVTVSVCDTLLLDPVATEAAGAAPCATCAPEASRTTLDSVTDCADPLSFWTVVVTLTVALVELMFDVATRVPV